MNSQQKRSRPSMADVAALANVSVGTVSRHLTGRGYVGADARQRIQSAVDELGYRPNLVARNLRTQTTNTIGVLSMGPLDFGSSSVLSGLDDASRQAGYGLITAQLPHDLDDPRAPAEIERAAGRLLAHQVDGIVLASPYPGFEDLWDELLNTIPFVTLSNHPRQEVGATYVDSYAAGRLATEHLVDLGHRAILHVRGPRNLHESSDRERGYRDVVDAAGIDAQVTVPCEDWSSTSGYRIGRLPIEGRWTAAFCANDAIALGFQHAMYERGLSAGRDYSVIAIDDMPDAAHFHPPLTTVALDHLELGRSAFRMILEHLRTGSPAANTVIEPALVRRESAVPPA
ncbi:LacI family DNA-binding transcriptional regulator [Microbacterium deminutum]|uniref:LacI family DNA-binding transcriptional regulator n=1 Tax=Microbacterium deminutum TaxID=344164 RepID=A0ABN2Q7U6_9MICO